MRIDGALGSPLTTATTTTTTTTRLTTFGDQFLVQKVGPRICLFLSNKPRLTKDQRVWVCIEYARTDKC